MTDTNEMSERDAAIIQAYSGTSRTVREIARQFKTSEPNLYNILELHKIKRRGRRFGLETGRKSRSIASVFMGIKKDQYVVGPADLENAKTILRKRGMVVFNATVDGSGPKGMVKCDGKLFTAEQIIERAAQ